MGLDELSMGAYSIPSVKRIIRSVSAAEAADLLNVVMAMTSGEEVELYLRNWLGGKFDD
jgi:phosphotransferase system enzyme I (PtsI)